MTRILVAALAVLISPMSLIRGQAGPPDIAGVYQAIPGGTTLTGGFKNKGSPANIPLLPAAARQMKTAEHADGRYHGLQ